MEIEKLIAELRHAADRSSDFHRKMAEDKSLRQGGNTERRTDLYMWATPEQTIEGRAATALTTMQDREATLIRALERCEVVVLEQRCERGTPWDLACTTIAAKVYEHVTEALGTSGLVERTQGEK